MNIYIYIIYIMYVFIGKEGWNRCDILKNLLDEKVIQYHYVDVNNMPHNTCHMRRRIHVI